MMGQSRYFSAVSRTFAIGLAVVVAFTPACSRAPETQAGPPEGAPPALAGYAPQRIVVVPAGMVRGSASDSLGWVAKLGGVRAAARRLDTSIVAILEERGLATRWVLPAELTRAYERNRAYAADPYQLVWDPVRSSRFKTGERYGEPLSSQLRTMIALHGDARYVLLPIELRFERDATGGSAGMGRGVLRAALVDARATEARWVGEVRGDVVGDHTAALASVAAKLVDLFVAP
jgi:hypothetical protein